MGAASGGGVQWWLRRQEYVVRLQVRALAPNSICGVQLDLFLKIHDWPAHGEHCNSWLIASFLQCFSDSWLIASSLQCFPSKRHVWSRSNSLCSFSANATFMSCSICNKALFPFSAITTSISHSRFLHIVFVSRANILRKPKGSFGKRSMLGNVSKAA